MQNVTSFTLSFFHQQQEILVAKELPYLCLEFGCCDLEKVLWLYFQK